MKPVLSHTEKSCVATILQSIFHEYYNKYHEINTSFVRLAFGSSGLTKLVLRLQFLIFIFSDYLFENRTIPITQLENKYDGIIWKDFC